MSNAHRRSDETVEFPPSGGVNLGLPLVKESCQRATAIAKMKRTEK